MLDKQAKSAALRKAAANLAAAGKYRCQFCRKERPLQEGLVTSWGGSVLFAMCPACFPGRPILIQQKVDSQGHPAVHVGFLRQEDKPADIVPVSSLEQLTSFVSQAAIAKYKKVDFGE